MVLTMVGTRSRPCKRTVLYSCQLQVMCLCMINETATKQHNTTPPRTTLFSKEKGAASGRRYAHLQCHVVLLRRDEGIDIPQDRVALRNYMHCISGWRHITF